MAQQQLLLIVLSVVIVGIATIVAVNLFKEHFRSSNERHLVEAMQYLAARAVTLYETPSAQFGLGHDYSSLTIQELLENTPATDIGSFSINHVNSDSIVILGTAKEYPTQKFKITVSSSPGSVERQ
jgi:hypothetical protein